MTGDNFVEGIWQGHLIEELCWWEKKSEERSTNLSAPTWSWACSNLETNPSFLFQFHGEHAGRHTEAELIDLDTKAGASDKADKDALKLSCKLLRAIFTPATTFERLDNDFTGTLELVDQGSMLKCRTPPRVANPNLAINIDSSYVGTSRKQNGYIVIFQRCFHDQRLRDLLEPGTECSTIPEEFQKSGLFTDGGGLEALFIQARNETRDEFERLGFIRCNHVSTVTMMYKAHLRAEKTVITLV